VGESKIPDRKDQRWPAFGFEHKFSQAEIEQAIAVINRLTAGFNQAV
jgi:hypothetical protein